MIKNGRGGEIRTHDLLYPKQARYQATLRPEPRQSRMLIAAAFCNRIIESISAWFSKLETFQTASFTASASTVRPSCTASSGIVRGGAIFTVWPQAPTGEKNSRPL